jgi:hypothetical protein
MFNFFKDFKIDEKLWREEGCIMDEKKTYTMDEHLKIKVAPWIKYQRKQLQNG